MGKTDCQGRATQRQEKARNINAISAKKQNRNPVPVLSSAACGNRNPVPVCFWQLPGTGTRFRFIFVSSREPEPGSGMSSASPENRNSVPVCFWQLAGTGTRFRFCPRQLVGTGTRFRFVSGSSREPEPGSGLFLAAPGNRNPVPVYLRQLAGTGTRFRFFEFALVLENTYL